MMSIFDFFKKGDKYLQFLSDCKNTIIGYEVDTVPSCENDLIDAIKTMTNGAKTEIRQGMIPASQYVIFINKLLANASFDLLASGKYHIFRGKLNPMSCASNLMAVHNKSIDYAIQNNLITQKEKEEDYKYLMECISSVG